MRIGIIAALPGELKPLVRGWKLQRSGRSLFIWKTEQRGDDLIAVCGGMGTEAAMRSFAAAEAYGQLDMVLSVGWVGALDSGMRTGECYIPSEIIDAQTGERFLLTEGKRTLRLVTTASVADRPEKRRLWQSYSAALVDMEAAAIVRLAQIRGIPVCCFKAVSDGTQALLPDMNPFISPRGQLRMAPFLTHIAIRPRFWKPIMALGRNSARASQSISVKVQKFLIEKDIHRTNRTGAV
jgi:adenosylhomocysteine nucleosidase